MTHRPRVAVYHNLADGGAHRAAIELIRRTEDRFEYTLLVPNMSGTKQSSPSSAVGIFPVPTPDFPGKLGELLSVGTAERKVARRVRSEGFDLLLAHPCRLTQTPHFNLPASVPTVLFVQEPRRKSFEKGYNRFKAPGAPAALRRMGANAVEPLLRHRDRQAISDGAVLLCNSVFSRESIQRAYGRTALVSHLGVDSVNFSIRPLFADQPYVLSVGGLEPAKGHDLLIEGLRLIPTAERPLAVIVGGRSIRGYQDHITSKAHASGVALEVRSNEPEEGLIALYQGATLTFCGSRLEPFGLTALESVSCGTPVVAVREGGFRESLTDGVNALFVERDPESVAAAISAVCSGKMANRESIRSSIFPYWSWESAADRFSGHLDRILSGYREDIALRQ